jgi:hypothetical protein
MASAKLEWSHGRIRPIVRADESTPIALELSGPINDERSGRFLPGNRAYRLRSLKAKAEGLATLDPNKCASWLRPFVELGRSYVVTLLSALEDKALLHPLAGDVADAHTMYRATLALAGSTDDPKERNSLMSEARGWLREHRAAFATLCALAGDLKLPTPDMGVQMDDLRKRLGRGPTD